MAPSNDKTDVELSKLFDSSRLVGHLLEELTKLDTSPLSHLCSLYFAHLTQQHLYLLYACTCVYL